MRGQEYGVTTGRRRKVNWLNMDKLIKSINITGTTHLIISKIDVLEKVNIYKYIYDNEVIEFENIDIMIENINYILNQKCNLLNNIIYSNNPTYVNGLLEDL